MTPQQVSSVTFIVIFIVLLVQLGLVFSPFLTTIMWAIILARLFYPMYRRVLQFSNGREGVAAGLSTFAVMTLVVAPTIYIIIEGVQESLDAYKGVTLWAEGGGVKQLGESLSEIPVIGRVGQQIVGRWIVTHGNVELSIVEASKRLSTFLVTEAGELVKNALLVVTDVFVILFTLFFLFRDGRRLFNRLYAAIPLESEHKERILHRLNGTVTAVVRGTLVTALAQGLVAGITYAALGVPFPVFLGALTAFLALLPFGGTAFVWGPVAVYLLATGALWKSVLMLIVGAGLVSLMDNVVYYWLTGAQAKLPVVLLFFASLGGIAYYGFIGLFLGPILLALVIAAFRIYEDEYRERQTRVILETYPERIRERVDKT
jgi:predicted PurR-regulated permease PerM